MRVFIRIHWLQLTNFALYLVITIAFYAGRAVQRHETDDSSKSAGGGASDSRVGVTHRRQHRKCHVDEKRHRRYVQTF